MDDGPAELLSAIRTLATAQLPSWLNDGSPWRDQPPGTVMIHGPGEAHGMRTSTEPLLTWFAWITDLDAHVHLD